jgi:16S rRNA (uracil1498-N3)-methyltransferase
MPVFFIPSAPVRDGMITITDPLLGHLRKSLRMAAGEELHVGDREGRRYRIRLMTVTKGEIQGQVLDERTAPARRHPSIVLGQAILKGDRMDWVIQKSTELGVAAIAPLVSGRVIVRPRTERVAVQQERWQRIALEAAQQAERWDVPVIHAPEPVDTWFARGRANVRLMLVERADAQPLSSIGLPEGPHAVITLCVGPEGGWTEEEKTAAVEDGLTPVALGERVLRAETAALAAVTIVQSRTGELG